MNIEETFMLILYIANLAACVRLAGNFKRNLYLWAFFSLIFGFIATIVLIFSGKKKDKKTLF